MDLQTLKKKISESLSGDVFRLNAATLGQPSTPAQVLIEAYLQKSMLELNQAKAIFGDDRINIW